jgi:hypothetical protein
MTSSSDCEVRVEYDERFLTRPWGIFCSCGFKGCAASEQEAERVRVSHKWEQERADSAVGKWSGYR